ncbi:hypothetical protein BGZ94_002723 [Podila epigama]|nr:hypothetical protein BGZ94_002723 [Podila epigama]
MKLTAAVALLASFAPSLVFASVAINWSFTTNGLTDIKFPFNIAKAPKEEGYFFAQKFDFDGQFSPSFIGLQPRPDANGQPVIRTVFSSLVQGTETNDQNCQHGADGGSGVGCGVDFSAPYDHTFDLEVRKAEGTTWQGWIVDTVTGEKVIIGSWTLPEGSGAIKGSRTGILEYYGTQSCDTLPYTSVVFGTPTSTVGTGSLGDAFEYGQCDGQAAFKQQRTNEGVEISIGHR